MNFLKADVISGDSQSATIRVHCGPDLRVAVDGSRLKSGEQVTVGIRPEHISVGDGPWEGVVGLSEHLGSDSFIKVEVPGIGTLNVRGSGELDIHHGDRIRLAPAGKIHRFDAQGLTL